MFASLTLFLFACGMSEEEKEQQAMITCNVIEATKRMDIASTIKEINAAREIIGEPLFLDNADTVEEAVFFGLCKNLVQNSVNWKEDIDNATTRLMERMLDVNLIDYQEIRESVPKSLGKTFASLPDGLLREMNYQAYKPYINGTDDYSEATRKAIQTCTGPGYALINLKKIGECPSE